jgi:hypothetical protein
MSQPPLSNPNARYWDDLVQDLDFSPEEQEVIRSGADQIIAEVRAQRLAEVRKRQHATQVEVAVAMGVSQARIEDREGRTQAERSRHPSRLRQSPGGQTQDHRRLRRRDLRPWITDGQDDRPQLRAHKRLDMARSS